MLSQFKRCGIQGDQLTKLRSWSRRRSFAVRSARRAEPRSNALICSLKLISRFHVPGSPLPVKSSDIGFQCH
ncbi:hypothetical protein HBI56_014000 [Parastagonospora nodorum]|uniref:Uncharacterized protein n=1 Tax=Phaeosphaeria nodorum (strain SN15 / ATCC MYA-4574 / FGSC 10173) TaxID=321614 RepID=A0A7U2F1G8_PHANO|nr:hypothetical protein HBH56_086010 [Parastagonospora nodorum]QRC96940.1 hypothetical protein JI435_409830 [Parastagonospora nodorum SN15]KAH3921182.1 hypothetical protein HBH54_244710 [Parastagonospora nodorum]KAH3955469.1 hypothetical protein HBH53_008760 [Parastagonospora nodorum]KAH3958581.1 hypothetical protein HBH52_250410 [Parastagonospora nodorum]